MRHVHGTSSRRIHLTGVCLVLILLTSSVGCGSNPTGPATTTAERGEIFSDSARFSFTVTQLEQLLAGTGLSLPFSPSYAVDTYEVMYGSVDGSGEGLVVSGALFQPVGADGLPLLSLQHGTVASRTQVASSSPLLTTEGMVGLLLASMGYMVVAPDYPGFGVSDIPHPYMHAASLVPSVVDLLRAARGHAAEQGVALDGSVYLTGYSEGGYVTLAAQKTIEEEFAAEFTLAAVAPLSGPYDLVGMMQSIFGTSDYPSPAYIAYLLTAYDRIYGWGRLNEMVQPVYAPSLPGLFDGSKTWAEVEGSLPEALVQLLNPAFVAGVLNGTDTDVLGALTENTLLDWGPVAPIHFFHGTADAIVPYQNALTAESRLNAHGAVSIQVTGIAGATHETAGPQAVVGAIQWFESIRSGSGVRHRN